jgi:O-antigen ligase
LLVIPVGILAILKSGSRAGVVSLAVALVFVGGVIWLRSFNSRGFGKAFAIAALPAFLFGLALAYYVVQELLQGRGQVEASSSSVRLKMLLDGVKALVDSPIWGFGHGMAIYKAGVISGGTGTATIDNYLLTIALDSGYVGLAIFIALIGTFAYKGAMAAVRLPGEEGARIGLIVASVLALVATFAGLSIPNNLTLMWLLVASGLPLINRAQAARRPT